MGNYFKDISCGFCSLPMREFKDANKRKKTFTLEIKGGSPDLIINLDPYDFNANMGLFKKMKRGHIISRLKLSVRYWDVISKEGHYNIGNLNLKV